MGLWYRIIVKLKIAGHPVTTRMPRREVVTEAIYSVSQVANSNYESSNSPD